MAQPMIFSMFFAYGYFRMSQNIEVSNKYSPTDVANLRSFFRHLWGNLESPNLWRFKG